MRSRVEAPRARVIVLAAGRGRRIGGPKALMLVGDRPWWRTQQHRLLDTGCDPLWVVSPDVRAALRREPDAPASLVTADPDRPMFESVRAGMLFFVGGGAPERTGRIGRSGENVPDQVFVLPVDVPAPSAATLRLLAAGAGVGVGVPVHAGRCGHPVCLSRDWIVRVLMPRLAGPSEGERLDGLIGADRVIVRVEDAAVIVNLNTPADAARWADTGA